MAGHASRTLKLNSINAIILLAFFPMIAIGAIYEKNVIVIGVFSVLALVSYFKFNRVRNNVKANSRVRAWMLYVAFAVITTLLHGRYDDIKGIAADISFLFIALGLSSQVRLDAFFAIYPKFMTFVGLLAIIFAVLPVNPFELMKAGSSYSAVDSFSGGGLSAFFEYRHYYAMLLVVAIWIHLYTAKERKMAYYVTTIILVLSVVLTYTRSAYVAFLFSGGIYILKSKKERIKKRTFLFITLIMILLLLGMALFYDSIVSNIFGRFSEVSRILTSGGGVRGYTLLEGTRHTLNEGILSILTGDGVGAAIKWLRQNPYGTWGEWNYAIDVQYVSTFMNTGLIGLVLVLRPTIIEWKQYFKDTNKYNNAISMSIISIAAGICFFDIYEMSISLFALWNILVSLPMDTVEN